MTKKSVRGTVRKKEMRVESCVIKVNVVIESEEKMQMKEKIRE